MKKLDCTATILLIVGGLNWGLSLFDVNLVTMLLGSFPMMEKLVYGCVGLSAVWKGYRKLTK